VVLGLRVLRKRIAFKTSQTERLSVVSRVAYGLQLPLFWGTGQDSGENVFILIYPFYYFAFSISKDYTALH
jgi:hypothetical protein